MNALFNDVQVLFFFIISELFLYFMAIIVPKFLYVSHFLQWDSMPSISRHGIPNFLIETGRIFSNHQAVLIFDHTLIKIIIE